MSGDVIWKDFSVRIGVIPGKTTRQALRMEIDGALDDIYLKMWTWAAAQLRQEGHIPVTNPPDSASSGD
jgi:hypothetical protein